MPNSASIHPKDMAKHSQRANLLTSKISFAAWASLLMLFVTISGCAKVENTEAYKSACHGAPLHTLMERHKALDDGYFINETFKCIDKTSFEAVAAQEAKIKAYNSPEAVAQRKAEAEERRAYYAEQAQKRTSEQAQPSDEPYPALREIDANTASQDDIEGLICIGTNVPAQIIEERNKRRFNDWADLINRVRGLSQAQSAVYASICGLTIDGKGLDGAPADRVMAAVVRWRFQQQTN